MCRTQGGSLGKASLLKEKTVNRKGKVHFGGWVLKGKRCKRPARQNRATILEEKPPLIYQYFFFSLKKKRKALKKLCFTVTKRKITPNSQSSPQNVQYNKGSSTSNQKTETEILRVMKFLPPTCRKKQKKTITQYFK